MTTAGTNAARPETSSPTIDPDSFARIARMVRVESGIVLSESKRSLTVSRLSRRLRQLGLRDFRSYCALLEQDDSAEERREMLFLLTTNVTRFFRENHHFGALRAQILPALIQRARAGGRVRIWSAGCSSGEEPYSIAMTVLDAFPDAPRHDIRILATDLDANMIAAGERGVYRGIDEGHLDEAALRKHSEPDTSGPDTYRIGEEARSLVEFAELNLLKPWPMKGPFDIIFCRNVVIYFDAETQSSLWSRFADILATSGTLTVGHSERVFGPALGRLKATGVTQYEKVAAGPASRFKEAPR